MLYSDEKINTNVVELGQAQLKLGMDFHIIASFGISWRLSGGLLLSKLEFIFQYMNLDFETVAKITIYTVILV